MLSCGLEIKKDTFLELDEKGQRAVLYDYLDHVVKKLDAIEKKEKTDYKEMMGMGAVFGFIGGVMAVIGKFLLIK